MRKESKLCSSYLRRCFLLHFPFRQNCHLKLLPVFGNGPDGDYFHPHVLLGMIYARGLQVKKDQVVTHLRHVFTAALG